ncbi:MAG: ATP synthase F1 subunit gamma [Cyclobacteriaceae bacterium]|jgi:F-type H+-transporting ATPase subunit gamma
MPSLKEVKLRITSVTSTQQITKAMKMVAAAKLRKSQDRIMQMRPFASKMDGLLRNLSASGGDTEGWYSKVREPNRVLLVTISSDRGLCGGFNSSVLKATNRRIQESYQSAQVTILPLGKKAFEFFSKRNYKVIADHWNIFSHLNFASSSAVSGFIMEAFRKEQFDRVEIIYNQFKNVATQVLQTEQFLPVQPPQEKLEGSADTDYIFQPDQQVILSGIIPKSLHVQLFKALLDSNAAENGARMTAMDKATENAGELLKDLRLTYNRTRQAAITKEILEIVAGAEALKG